MTADMPPPPQPSATNWLRVAGIIVAFSAPISGFVLYAIVATAFGEDRLEGDSGLTAIGWMMFVIPVVIGAGLFLVSLTDRNSPDLRAIGFVVGGLAALCTVFGVLALLSADAGDASIGGGLLLLTAAALAAVAVFCIRGSRSARSAADHSPRL